MAPFSAAIAETVSPRNRSWSSAIRLTRPTGPSAMVEASHRPPIPTSNTAASTGRLSKARKAAAVIVSKKEGWYSRGKPAEAAATSPTNPAKSSGGSGLPSRTIRSSTETRCGEVNRPTRRPCARSTESRIATVEPLPFVPATTTAGIRRCGFPRRSARWRMFRSPTLTRNCSRSLRKSSASR